MKIPKYLTKELRALEKLSDEAHIQRNFPHESCGCDRKFADTSAEAWYILSGLMTVLELSEKDLTRIIDIARKHDEHA